jgi:hypothetical protein
MDPTNTIFSEKSDREYILPQSHTRREMPPRRIRTWTAGFALVAIIYLAWSYSHGTELVAPLNIGSHWSQSERSDGRVDCGRGKERLEQSQTGMLREMNKELVPLEAHIMSKCPDAQVITQLLDL